MTIVAAIAIWELSIPLFDIAPTVLASPTEIVAVLVEEPELFRDATLTTTYEIIVGFGFSVLIGMGLAICLARFPVLDLAFYPLIVIFQIVPKVALAPILVLWFGYTTLPKVLLVIAIAFFPIVLNMRDGLASVNPDLVNLMRSVGSSKNQILWRVAIPTSVPYLFAGLRIAVTFAVIGAIVAELAGSDAGLGFLILYYSTQLETALVFAGIVSVSLVGLLLYYSLVMAEWLLGRRYPGMGIGPAST